MIYVLYFVRCTVLCVCVCVCLQVFIYGWCCAPYVKSSYLYMENCVFNRYLFFLAHFSFITMIFILRLQPELCVLYMCYACDCVRPTMSTPLMVMILQNAACKAFLPPCFFAQQNCCSKFAERELRAFICTSCIINLFIWYICIGAVH